MAVFLTGWWTSRNWRCPGDATGSICISTESAASAKWGMRFSPAIVAFAILAVIFLRNTENGDSEPKPRVIPEEQIERSNQVSATDDRETRVLTALIPGRADPLQKARVFEDATNRECFRIYVGLPPSKEFTVRWRALDRLRSLSMEDLEFYASAEELERLEGVARWEEWLATKGGDCTVHWSEHDPE